MQAHGPQLLTAMIGGLDDGDDPQSLVALEAMLGLAKLLDLVEPGDLRSALLHVAIRIRPFFDSVGWGTPGPCWADVDPSPWRACMHASVPWVPGARRPRPPPQGCVQILLNASGARAHTYVHASVRALSWHRHLPPSFLPPPLVTALSALLTGPCGGGGRGAACMALGKRRGGVERGLGPGTRGGEGGGLGRPPVE